MALVSGLVIAGCGIGTQDGPTEIDASRLPARLTEPPTTTGPAIGIDTTERRQIDLWYVQRDQLTARSKVVNRADGLMDLLNVLAEQPENESLRTTVPEEVVSAADIALGQATIELSPLFADIVPSDQILAIAQLVLTATEFPGVGLVRFTVDGEPITVPGADGRQIDGPLSRDDYAELIAR